MKVLFVGVTYPIETFIERLIKGLLNKNVEILIASNNQPNKNKLTHKNLKYLYLFNSKSTLSQKAYWLFTTTFFSLSTQPRNISTLLTSLFKGKRQAIEFTNKSIFKKLQWDVTYFPWNSAAIKYQFLFNFKQATIISCRGAQINIAPHNPRRHSIKKGLIETFSKASAVHCVSKAILTEATSFYLDPKKTSIIRPAINTKLFAPNQHPIQTPLKIITTGSLIWRKGYEYSLLALQLLKKEGIPFEYIIIGDGPDHQRIQFTIFDLDLGGSVQLLGNLNTNTVRDYLRKSDIFLFSSLSEGISNAILEAMACEVVVVSTDCGGTNEVIQNGINGYLTPLRDPISQFRHLKSLSQNPSLIKTLGKNARKKILESHQIENQIKSFYNLFKKHT